MTRTKNTLTPIAIKDIPEAAKQLEKNRVKRVGTFYPVEEETPAAKKVSRPDRVETMLAEYERVMEELRLAHEHRLVREELVLSFERDHLERTLRNMYETGQFNG